MPPVFLSRDLALPPLFLPSNSTVLPLSPPRDSTAPLMSPPRDPTVPPLFLVCVFVMPAAAPAPAAARQAAEPLLFQLIKLCPAFHRGLHCRHRRRQSCQARRSTAQPAVSLLPASAPWRIPTRPSLRFPSP